MGFRPLSALALLAATALACPDFPVAPARAATAATPDLAAPPDAAPIAGALLTVDEAIRLALLHNRNLKVTLYDKGISRADLLAAKGQFDPAFVVSRTAYDTREQATIGFLALEDIRTDYYSAALQGFTPWGMNYSIGENATNERDDLTGYVGAYQTFGGFSVTQPLLQGFGFAANLLGVRVAKANRSISDWEYRQSAIDTVTNVVIACSNLQYARDSLDTARRTRGLAQSLLAGNEKSYHIGSVAQSEVVTAREQVLALEEPILIAERAVEDSENVLLELIGADVSSAHPAPIGLVRFSMPEIPADPRADLPAALDRRPDYQEARLGIVKDRANEAAAANGLLPQLNLVAGYGYTGLAASFAASRRQVATADNPSYSAGLTLTLPLTFAAGRGKARSARLQREQAEADLRRLEADISVSIANAAGQVETTRRRVANDRAAYTLAQQALEAEEKKLRAGTSTTLAVLQVQQYLAAAENNVSGALAAERQAAAVYDHEIALTLERHQIDLAHE